MSVLIIMSNGADKAIKTPHFSCFPSIRLSIFPLQVEIEGLTGDIKFNDDGRRVNYTLHVVEMTVNSAMVSNGIRVAGATENREKAVNNCGPVRSIKEISHTAKSI